MKRLFTIFALVAVTGAGLLCGGCSPEPAPRAFFFLVDESGSFEDLWEESLDNAANIVKHMNRAEGYCLVGIDNHGFDEDDVRVAPGTLPHTIYYRTEIVKLVKEIKELRRREYFEPGTDIPGALQHAYHLYRNFRGEAQGTPAYRPVIVIFSDMYPDHNWNMSKLHNVRFPEATEVYCFNVRAKGREGWEGIVDFWIDTFNRIGIKVTRDNFFTVKETPQAVQRIFSQERIGGGEGE